MTGTLGATDAPESRPNKLIKAAKMTEQGLSRSERKRLVQEEYRQANKEKIRKYQKEYYSSREGIVTKIYNGQKQSSKRRNHPLPDYRREELRAWLFSNPKFETLYQRWADSGFDRMQAPSCDRLDDYKPYTLDNLRLVTWAENNARGGSDIKAGINNKKSKAVLQFTKAGAFVTAHHSINHAGRMTGINPKNLSACCNGRKRSAGGFVWLFADSLRSGLPEAGRKPGEGDS